MKYLYSLHAFELLDSSIRFCNLMTRGLALTTFDDSYETVIASDLIVGPIDIRDDFLGRERTHRSSATYQHLITEMCIVVPSIIQLSTEIYQDLINHDIALTTSNIFIV